MRIVLIGAGAVATHLGLALRAAGHEMAGVWSRTQASASALAARLDCQVVTAPGALPQADACIFSVSDDALPALIHTFAPHAPGALLVHTAGSVPLSVFGPCAARCAVLYPLQTFSRSRAVDFAGVPCFVEGSDDGALRQVTALAATVARSVTPLDSARRRMLHLSAVFACNFANHCYAVAADVLEREGLDGRWLLPLIDETARKVHELTPREAQTGPAVRGDRTVMERQRALLAGHDAALAVYDVMSRSIHEYARTGGAPAAGCTTDTLPQ